MGFWKQKAGFETKDFTPEASVIALINNFFMPFLAWFFQIRPSFSPNNKNIQIFHHLKELLAKNRSQSCTELHPLVLYKLAP